MTIEGLGQKFQEARQTRGLSLDDAARLTKIRPSRLAEIEADDFSQFPSLAYAKGFLQIYGKFLDVDVSPYLDAFETSSQVTVDGYSYLQDQPAPKPQRVRARPREPVARQPRDRSSPVPFLIAVGAIVIGFVLMKLILDIQRIAPHQQMVGVPQPPGTESATTPAPVAVTTPAPTASIPPRVSTAPSPRPTAVAEAQPKKSPPVATAAPSIPIPDAFVPAFAKANAAATATAAPPNVTVAPTAAVAKATAAPSPAVTASEPQVRRAEPVRPEDLAKAGVTQSPSAAAAGPNRVAIKPLKKTYIKVVVDNETVKPAFERWISPADGTVEFSGQHIAVRVLDRDAIQIRKNGKSIAQDDTDVTVE
jgi:cytoskeletal protein RodZ